MKVELASVVVLIGLAVPAVALGRKFVKQRQ
jgi:hypothetical protein